MGRSLARRMAVAAAVAMITALTVSPATANVDTGTISGHVTTSDGQAAPLTSINLFTASYDYVATSGTDEAGDYTFSDVPAGDYKLQFYPAAGPSQWAHDQLTFEDATTFSVTAGATTTVDESLLPTGTIAGRLVDANGQPVPNIQATAETEDFSLSAYAMTDADGTFSLSVLTGSYRIGFFSVGGGIEQWVPQTRDRFESQLFAVAAGEQVTINETLFPTGSLRGRLVDAAGLPVASATVSAWPTEGTGVAFSFTDDNGEYRYERLFAGSYVVRFDLPNGLSVWAHGARSEADATRFTIEADGQTVVDETLPSFGTIAGRFTDASGAGVAGVAVSASTADESVSLTAYTDGDGAYSMTAFVDSYRVRFSTPDGHHQYATNKTDWATADVFAVTADATTTVDDTPLPTGTLRFTATDTATGAPVSAFCVTVEGNSNADGCTDNGVLDLTGRSIGRYTAYVTSDAAGYLSTQVSDIQLAAGDTTEVAVRLTKGAFIITTVVDRRTGAPAMACLAPSTAGSNLLPEGIGACTAEDGTIRIGPLPADRKVNLFVYPAEGSGLGAQWVGLDGGTGDVADARRISLVSGQTHQVPTIRLDPAGAIAGTVTSAASGAIQTSGFVSIVAWTRSGPSWGAEVGTDGRYRVDWLGPYKWKLYFEAGEHARQWSGATSDRREARQIQVRAGQTTTFDASLKRGTLVTGAVRDAAGTMVTADLDFYHAATGDNLGGAWAPDGTYRMLILGEAKVKVQWYVSHPAGPTTGWYDDDADFASARSVDIPKSGTRTLDITVA